MKNKLKEGFVPKWRKRMPEDWEHPKPKFPPELTNKQRFEIRQKARKDAAEIVKRAGL